MNSEWSLDELYKGFDDPKFAADLAKYDEMIAKTNEFAAKISDMQPLDALKTYIAGSESSMQLLTDMYSYAMLRSSVNTKDTEAASISGRLMAKMSATTKAETIIKKFISEIPNLDELIESDPVLKEYEFLLKNIRADQKHTMSDECEEVAALYNISGASASVATPGRRSMPTARTTMATTPATRRSTCRSRPTGRRRMAPPCPTCW